MWAASALHKVGEDKHSGPGGGREAARIITPRCRLRMGIHVPRPPTRLQDVHMEQLYSPVRLRGVTVAWPRPMTSAPHPKWLWQSMFPPYAWSSHSGEGTAWASLDQDEALEDDFQTQHMPVHHVMWWEDNSHRSSAEGRLECSRGSPGQRTGYCVDIGEEEETLETVDPTWQTTRWLQLAVQGISALSLAKCLLAAWQWSVRV